MYTFEHFDLIKTIKCLPAEAILFYQWCKRRETKHCQCGDSSVCGVWTAFLFVSHALTLLFNRKFNKSYVKQAFFHTPVEDKIKAFSPFQSQH